MAGYYAVLAVLLLIIVCLSAILSISYRVEHASLQTYQRRLSVRPSALMHAKLLFPDKRSRFNERRAEANLHAFVPIIQS